LLILLGNDIDFIDALMVQDSIAKEVVTGRQRKIIDPTLSGWLNRRNRCQLVGPKLKLLTQR
jgi:hypothetical protein